MSRNLINIDDDTNALYEFLARSYWPGPMTIILKSNPKMIDPKIIANSDFVGIRYPNCKVINVNSFKY